MIGDLMDYDELVKQHIKELRKTPLKWFRDTLDLRHEGDIEEKVLCCLLMIATYFGTISHVLLTGESSSGKTSLLDACRGLIPEEDYLYLLGATESSVKNAEELLSTINFLIFTEFDAVKSGQDESLEFLMRMLSSEDSGGDFLKCEQYGNDWKPVRKKLVPKSLFTTYAKGTHNIGNENLNRLWIIEPEQSETKTRDVIGRRILQDEFEGIKQKKQYGFRAEVFIWNYINGKAHLSKDPFKKREVYEEVEVTKKNVMGNEVTEKVRQLKETIEYKIKIPYRSTLLYMFRDASETRATRDIKRFVSLIEIITKLHIAMDSDCRAILQTDNYDPVNQGSIIWYLAEPQDFILACELSWLTIQQNMRNLTDADIKLYQTLIEMEIKAEEDSTILYDEKEWGFTPKEICDEAEVSYEYGRKRIWNLAKYGLVIRSSHPKNSGKRTYYWSSQASSDSIADWWIYQDLVERDCKDFMKRHEIEKNFEKYYSIYNNPDEMPVNRLSNEHERVEKLATLRAERVKSIESQESIEHRRQQEFLFGYKRNA